MDIADRIIWYGLVSGVVEVYHKDFGRGIVDLFRARTDPKLPCRCIFRKKPFWQYLEWENIFVLAWHPELPKHLAWIHPKDNRPPRKNRFVPMASKYGRYDTDRNRDMEADSEKWNADAGFKPEVETTVQQIYEHDTRAAIERHRIVDIDYRKPKERFKWPTALSQAVSLTIAGYITEQERKKCSRNQTGKSPYARLAAASAFGHNRLAGMRQPKLSKEQLQRLCSAYATDLKDN